MTMQHKKTDNAENRSLHPPARPLASDMRNPLAKARDEWLESAEGERAANPDTINTAAPRHYLENRLRAAFIAGANWMERHKQRGKRPSAKVSYRDPE